MSLRLTLSPGERLFIGTASLVVASDATVTIIIDGDLPVLREKDVLAEGESTGEAAKFYLALQTMYLTGEVAQRLVEFRAQAEELRQRLPGSGPLIAEIEAEMHNGSIYRALKVARRLLEMGKGTPRPAKEK